MARRSNRPVVEDELLALLPEAAKTLLLAGPRTLETEDGEWKIEIHRPPEDLSPYLPCGAVVVTNNGYGDFLFLQPSAPAAEELSPATYVYWHEGPEIKLLSSDLALLGKPASAPSAATKPRYDNGEPVLVGDHVELRVWVKLFRKLPGTVVYVPGISKRRPQMGHDALTWVGIRMDDDGAVVGAIVDPETGRLKKGVTLLSHA